MAAYYLAEGEFVSELIGLLEADTAVPEDLRTLALRALAVQLLDRQRHSAVISTVSMVRTLKKKKNLAPMQPCLVGKAVILLHVIHSY